MVVMLYSGIFKNPLEWLLFSFTVLKFNIFRCM